VKVYSRHKLVAIGRDGTVTTVEGVDFATILVELGQRLGIALVPPAQAVRAVAVAGRKPARTRGARGGGC
jgi:hypothetical protein